MHCLFIFKPKTQFMKAKILSLAAIVFSSSLIFTACQKNTKDDTDYNNESTVHSDDQSRFSGEMDSVTDDADATLDATPGFTGRGDQVQTLICNATVVVDTLSNPR